jgi:flagellar hook-basal body complex protein FliE
MSNMQVDSVLSQIRAMSSQVSGVKPQLSRPTGAMLQGVNQAPGQTDANGFAALMRNAVNQVNQAQIRAGDMATAFERGTPGVELPDVMLEMQKASVQFRALTEVRNRFVNVYQEIMSMPI